MTSDRFKCGCKTNPTLVYCLSFPGGVGRQEERERSMRQVTAEPSPTSQLMPEVRGETRDKREAKRDKRQERREKRKERRDKRQERRKKKREPSGKATSKNL